MQAFQLVGFTPVLTENLTNGDCFFSAIYRSLNSRGLIPEIAGCLDLKHTSEAEFIQEARNLVATHVIAGDARDIYVAYGENFLIDLDSLKFQIRSAPVYLQNFIDKKIKQLEASTAKAEANPRLPPVVVDFYTYEEFAIEVAKHIRTSGTWVGETEVTIFRNLLKLCNVVTDVYSSSMPKTNLPKRGLDDKIYIYLYNMGEIHWKHFILKDPGVQITLSRSTTPGIINSRWSGGKRKRSTRRRKVSRRRTRKA
jgi:hypothetical protein